MQAIRALSATLLAAALMLAAQAEAGLVKLEIAKREVIADGASFGDAGPYEKLTGRAWFEVDPTLERNKAVFDIDRAPLNKAGKVEFSADMVILKPVDMELSSKTLFFEVNNRGRKISFGRMHDTASDANMNDPMAARDFGNGFLMKRGYVISWVGWGADIAPGDSRLTVNFPVAPGKKRTARHGTHPDGILRPQLQWRQTVFAALVRRGSIQILSGRLFRQKAGTG